jgi:hypothetical protein
MPSPISPNGSLPRAVHTQAHGPLGKNGHLGPFQGAVQIGKGAHARAGVHRRQTVECGHCGGDALLFEVAQQGAQLRQGGAVPRGHPACIQNHPAVARQQQQAHLLRHDGPPRQTT